MKKLAVLSALIIGMLAGVGVQAQTDTSKDTDIAGALLMYIPNRIVDMVDMFSLDLGFGPSAKADMRVTRAFSFGAGTGATAMALKGYNRQYGCSLDDGYDMSFAWIANENSERSHSLNNVQEYWYHSSGMPKPSERIYNWQKGARDYWAIEAGGALFVQVDFAIHPVDIADFITGFFFYDLKGDDYTLDDTSF